ncbi:MAG TPA: cyclase family protein [Acidimicrobiales bacterium]|nr:cyclase family protein [Acidimicrobiales bacterium]
MTEEAILEAVSEVSCGRVFDLGLPVDRRSFASPFHPGTVVTRYRTPEGLRREDGFERGGVGFNTSLIVICDHVGTHLDGLSHAVFGVDDHFYNGFTVGENTGDFGLAKASIATMPPIVLKAVLLDVAGRVGVDYLGAGFAITAELLAETLESQGCKLVPGEAVFVRTGSLRFWGEGGHDHAAIAAADTAGLTLGAARWLVEERGAILIGSDTSTVEVTPPVDGDNMSPVHKYLLVDQGVCMGELHYLEELAEASIHRFCYFALPPKIRGVTGTCALRPVALV